MSVVTRDGRRRWATVAAGVTALVVSLAALPSAVGAVRGNADARPPADVLAMAAASAAVEHSGLVDIRGGLGLPDLPRLGRLAALLGGTTRARTWWRSESAWRVATLTNTGEVDVYRTQMGIFEWDFEEASATQVIGVPPLRLPRTDDMLPPQAARRLLAGLAGDEQLSALEPRRIAGRAAVGVRIVPADGSGPPRRCGGECGARVDASPGGGGARSGATGDDDNAARRRPGVAGTAVDPRRTTGTIGALDLFIDDESGLPLELTVTARGSSVPALESRFVTVDLGQPAADVLSPRVLPGVLFRTETTPDLLAAVDREAPFDLPGTLAGYPREDGAGLIGGAATYGTGLARFVVLPLPRRLGRQVLEAALDSGASEPDVRGARAALVRTPLLLAVSIAGRGTPEYLVAGTVADHVLIGAAQELVDARLGAR